MTAAQRVQLEERRDDALADLRDLERQVDRGEIDEPTARSLRRTYEAAAVAALEALDALKASRPTSGEGRSRTRMWLGIGGFVLVAVVVTVALVKAVEPRPPGGFTTGGVASDVIEDGGVALATVTNEEMEAVVAENPDIIPMRLALARRYVEGGDFSAALPHYMYVLDQGPNAEALMYVGWMTYVSGDAATGVALIERSLEVAPDDPLAQWFLANALLYGLEDADRAIPVLEALIASDQVPEEIAVEARRMLDEARA